MAQILLLTVEEQLEELLSFLPGSVRLGAEEELRSMLLPLAKVRAYLAIRRAKLLELYTPATLTEDLAGNMAANLGWGDDLAAAAAVSKATLRKILPAAVRLWKTKGAQASFRTAIAAVTGSRALVLSWHELRTVSGTARALTLIPAGGGIGAPYTYPEQVLDLWYMDPDGTVDAVELARVLEVMRPSGERLNLRGALLLDDLLQGDAFWARQGSGHSYNETPAGPELRATGTAGWYAELGGASEAWTDYRLTMRLELGGTDPGVRVELLQATEGDGDECYRVEIDQLGGEVRLYRVDAGVGTLLGTYTGMAIATAYAYDWTFEVAAGGAGTTVRIYLEGVLVLSGYDAHADRKLAGGIAWAGLVNTSEVALSYALAFAPSPPSRRVGPTT